MARYAKAGLTETDVSEMIADALFVPDGHTDDDQIMVYDGGWVAVPRILILSRDPTTSDTDYLVGQICINTVENTSFILLNPNAGYWRRL